MRVSRYVKNTSSFVVKRDDVEKLTEKILSKITQVRYEAICFDGMTRTFNSLAGFNGYENVSRKKITELKIVARDFDKDQRFSLSLDQSDNRNILISIEGEEADAEYLSDCANSFVENIRPWYDWIAKADFMVLVGNLILITILTLFGYIFISQPEVFKKSFEKPFSAQRDLLPVFFFGLLPSAMGFILNRVKRKFFPMGSFALGDGVNRFGREESIRSLVVIAFIISILSSLVVGFF